MLMQGRTDLAMEARQIYQAAASEGRELPGVRVSEERLGTLTVSTVELSDPDSARKLGKPPGRYCSLELPEDYSRGRDSFQRCVEALSRLLRRCMPERFETVLVAALGNPDISPDALGSLAAGSLLVTAHLKDREPETFRDFSRLYLCRPGVLGTSGIESARQVELLCRELRPQLVAVVDALAGADAGRLCRSIQVTDSGIAPGSGVGNDRRELSRETLGVPVVAVGMPTVTDAAALGGEGLGGMFLTPRDIDYQVRRAARVIGYGLDLALHPGLTVDDIDLLIG